MNDAATLQHVRAEERPHRRQSGKQAGAPPSAGFADTGSRASARRQMQAMADGSARVRQLQSQAASLQAGARQSNASGGLPSRLKSGIESLSGMNMDHVRVNLNSDRPARLQAHAYAQGSDIHIAPGQERHLPHEAWHVVQQMQGRVKPTMQLKHGVPVNDDAGLESEADRMGAQALAAGTLQAMPHEATGAPVMQTGVVAQLASMLVLIGLPQDRKDLAVNTELEEKNFGVKSVLLAAANLGAIRATDALYLSGAHGDAGSYGPYQSGQALVDALWLRGLRVVRFIVLTGCETGNGFSEDFYGKAIAKGIDIKEYVTAPKTYAATGDGGRLTAETPERARVGRLRTEKEGLGVIERAFGTREKEIEDEIDRIVSQPGYWAMIENPLQLADEVREMYDSLDRYYAAHEAGASAPEGSMDYKTYKEQFDTVKNTYNPRLQKAAQVWAVHGKQSVATAFFEVVNRKPAERKIWDLSDLLF